VVELLGDVVHEPVVEILPAKESVPAVALTSKMPSSIVRRSKTRMFFSPWVFLSRP